VNSGIRNSLIWIAAFIAMVLGLFLFSFFSTRTLSEEQYQTLGYYRFESPRPIGDFSLVDQQGNKVGHDSLVGQWSLVYFGFSFCPDVCPTTLATLKQVRERMKQPPRVIMVTVDPERDTPQQLAQYLGLFDPSFIGFTGDFDAIVGLATQLNVAFGKVPGPTPGSYTVDHSAVVVVVDPSGQYAGFIKPPLAAENIVTIMQSLM